MKVKNNKKTDNNLNNDTTEVLEETKNENNTGAQEIKLESGSNSKILEQQEIEKLKGEKEVLEKEKQELIDKLKLSTADLINYRRRKDEEVQGMLKFANQDLITELIVVVDNFERAIESAKKSNIPEVLNYISGIEMIYNSLMSILKKYGVEEINRLGEVFDPKQEEALVSDNDPTKEDEVVLEVLQKGYKLKDRVIRPARVKINQK